MQEQVEVLKIIVNQTDGSLKVQNRCSQYRIMLQRKAMKIYKELPDRGGSGGGRGKKKNLVNQISTSKMEAQKKTGKSKVTLNKWAKETEIDEEVLEGRPWF